MCCSVLVRTSVLTVCCSVLARTSGWTFAHCKTLQQPASHSNQPGAHDSKKQTATKSCNTLQHTATHCNTLGVHDSMMQRASRPAATHCNTLQLTAAHCNTLQLSATHCNSLQHTATHCNTLQTHRNSLQLAATRIRPHEWAYRACHILCAIIVKKKMKILSHSLAHRCDFTMYGIYGKIHREIDIQI